MSPCTCDGEYAPTKSDCSREKRRSGGIRGCEHLIFVGRSHQGKHHQLTSGFGTFRTC